MLYFLFKYTPHVILLIQIYRSCYTFNSNILLSSYYHTNLSFILTEGPGADLLSAVGCHATHNFRQKLYVYIGLYMQHIDKC